MPLLHRNNVEKLFLIIYVGTTTFCWCNYLLKRLMTTNPVDWFNVTFMLLFTVSQVLPQNQYQMSTLWI